MPCPGEAKVGIVTCGAHIPSLRERTPRFASRTSATYSTATDSKDHNVLGRNRYRQQGTMEDDERTLVEIANCLKFGSTACSSYLISHMSGRGVRVALRLSELILSSVSARGWKELMANVILGDDVLGLASAVPPKS